MKPSKAKRIKKIATKRHGKCVAEIDSQDDGATNKSWKRPALKLAIKDVSLSSGILAGRKASAA